MRLERRNRQADEANENASLAQLGRAQTKAVPLEMCFDSIHTLIALFARQHAGEKLHDARGGIHSSERLSIGRPPASKNQPFGLSDHHPRYWDTGSVVVLVRTPF